MVVIQKRGRGSVAGALLLVLAVVATGGVTSGARATNALRAGAAWADITPDLGRNFDGYVRPDTFAKGVAIRLRARAIVLERGDTKLGIVSVDLGFGSGFRRAVAAQLADLGFTSRNLFLAGSHTHAGPDLQINTMSTTSGAADVKAFIAAQIAAAVRQANANLRPAVLGWADVEVADANDNRSIEAHLANHGFDLAPHTASADLDPLGPGHLVDRTMHVLRVDAVDESTDERTPMAAWFRFSAHDTSFPPANELYTADWSAIAGWRFEQALAAAGHPGVLAMFANGNEGDMVSRNDSFNSYSTADSQGKKVARALNIAWEKAGRNLIDDPILDVRTAIICFCGQEVEGGSVASEGWAGLSFFGGAENGPSIFYQPIQTEGKRRPAEAADPVQGRKILVAPIGGHNGAVELVQIRVGEALVAGIVGEPTIEVGRRVQAAMRLAADLPAAGIARTVVVGLAGEGSVGYWTTPEEYDQHHYEAGVTLWGKWSSNLIIATHEDLTRRMLGGLPDPEPQASISDATTGEPPVLTGDGGVAGAITVQPATEVPRMEIVTMEWTGGPGGNDRPLDAAFLTLQREVGDSWATAATDLDIGFQWRFEDGVYRAVYDILPSLAVGTYRLRVTSGSYTPLDSRPFEVVSSRRLIVRGVEAKVDGGDTVFAFHATNPAPDPDRNLWDRERVPAGGSLTFRLQPGGEDLSAEYDPITHTWVARLAGVLSDRDVVVPDGGLTDGWGNTSGAGRVFRPGSIEATAWPPNMPVGGFCVPGAFAQGCFYPHGLFPWPPKGSQYLGE
ncbi:MAG: neutral/alkaline non-lysosomal ceramidase N-terminal domain-containing protein [Actinomycetota bacterium]